MLETYLNDLIGKESNIVNILREANSAIQSIKSINENSESETLVPMGIGTFVKAKIPPNQKLVVNLGAGLCKVRTPRTGKGKSSGYRTLVVYREMEKAILMNS